MKHNLFILTLHAAALLLATACCDEDVYEPGKPTQEGSVGAYFDQENPSEFIFEPGKAEAVKITVCRRETDNEVEVPIVCQSKTDGVEIPSSVTFKDGEATATLEIKVRNPEVSVRYTFSIAIDEAFANHYAEVEGSSYYSSVIMEEQWRMLSDQATLHWTVMGQSYATGTTIEQLGSLERYRITNFLETGLDFIFEKGASATVKGNHLIKPLANYIDDSDDVMAGFYFTDLEDDEFVWYYQNVGIEYIYFITTYFGSGDYSYFSIDNRRITLTPITKYIGNETLEYYNYLYVTW